MIPAIAYLRCSGRDQILGDTWERQLIAILAYAKANDIEIVQEFRDEGVSGKMELENRPGLAACLERVENNGAKLVIVEDALRLARDSMVSELIIRQFQKTGAKVISAAAGVDLTAGDDANPTAKLVRQILAAVAEWDRCVVVLKLKAARDRKKALRVSGHGAFGRKPFGFMSGGHREADIPNPAEFPTLQLIQDMHRRGIRSDMIAEQLNKLNVTSRAGKLWRPSVIRKILARDRVTSSCTAA